MLPVNSPWAFLRLDVYVIMVHLQLGNFHFKEVGLKLDCPAHCAKVWPLRWFEDILWCWRRHGSCGTRTQTGFFNAFKRGKKQENQGEIDILQMHFQIYTDQE